MPQLIVISERGGGARVGQGQGGMACTKGVSCPCTFTGRKGKGFLPAQRRVHYVALIIQFEFNQHDEWSLMAVTSRHRLDEESISFINGTLPPFFSLFLGG